MPKKVAIIYQGAKYYGGIETYLEQLFANVDSKKIELTLVSLGEWELGNKIQNTKYIIPKEWYQLSNFKLIINYLKENKIDLVVSQGMVGSFYARIATLFTKIPNLIVVHSDWHYDYPGFKKILFWISDRLFRFTTKRYITVSEYLKTNLNQEGVDRDKITTIYNGVSRDVIPTKVEESISKKGSLDAARDDKTITLGSVGRLHPVKNYDSLIKAIDILRREGKYILKLEIAGEGFERKKLEKIINKLDLEKNVTLLGNVKDVRQLYKKWDLYIQPSLSEGFGITVVEAMLADLPVIVTPAGSLPELITDGKTGMIAKYFGPSFVVDAFERALKDKEFMENAGAAARKEALKRFGVKKWVNNLEKIFIEVAK